MISNPAFQVNRFRIRRIIICIWLFDPTFLTFGAKVCEAQHGSVEGHPGDVEILLAGNSKFVSSSWGDGSGSAWMKRRIRIKVRKWIDTGSKSKWPSGSASGWGEVRSLSWLTNSALTYEPKCGGRGRVAGSQLVPGLRIGIRTGSGFNRVSGSGYRRAKMTHRSRIFFFKFMFWSVGWPLLRAEGFFCNLDVLYGGPGICTLNCSF